MEQPDFKALRTLIVGAKGYAASMLRVVLNASGIARITVIEDGRQALDVLCLETYDAVFIEEGLVLDGIPFAVAARRTKALRNPLIPIFVVHSGPRRHDVERSRDLGVNGVIARPVSPKTVVDKLRAAIHRPRPFVAASSFFGPDRRSDHLGIKPLGDRERRLRLPRKTKMHLLEL